MMCMRRTPVAAPPATPRTLTDAEVDGILDLIYAEMALGVASLPAEDAPKSE